MQYRNVAQILHDPFVQIDGRPGENFAIVNRQNAQKIHLFFYLQFSKFFGIIYLESEREIKREWLLQGARLAVTDFPTVILVNPLSKKYNLIKKMLDKSKNLCYNKYVR